MQLRQLHTCPKQTDQEKKEKKIYKSSDYHALLSSVIHSHSCSTAPEFTCKQNLTWGRTEFRRASTLAKQSRLVRRGPDSSVWTLTHQSYPVNTALESWWCRTAGTVSVVETRLFQSVCGGPQLPLPPCEVPQTQHFTKMPLQAVKLRHQLFLNGFNWIFRARRWPTVRDVLTNAGK